MMNVSGIVYNLFIVDIAAEQSPFFFSLLMRPPRNWRRCQNECGVKIHFFTNKVCCYQVVQVSIGFRYRSIRTIPNTIEAGFETWRVPDTTLYARYNYPVRCCGNANFNCSGWRQPHPNTTFVRKEISRIFKKHIS